MSLELASRAAALWGLDGSALCLAAQRENMIFRAEGESGARFALRQHRDGYQSVAALRSELAWMAQLKADGISVPRAIPSRNGALVEEVGGRYFDLITWIDGAPLGQTGTPLALRDPAERFEQIGRMMARLHASADAWPLPEGFTRPAWDREGLLGSQPLWGRFWQNPALSSEEAAKLASARDRACQTLQDGRFDTGLIHADLVRENVLLDPNGVHFIDFDDCGFGYRLFDVATALFKNLSEPDYPALEQALITGYRSHRPLETEQLPLFMALRAFTYLGWIIPRMAEPGAQDRLARFKRNALLWAERV